MRVQTTLAGSFGQPSASNWQRVVGVPSCVHMSLSAIKGKTSGNLPTGRGRQNLSTASHVRAASQPILDALPRPYGPLLRFSPGERERRHERADSRVTRSLTGAPLDHYVLR